VETDPLPLLRCGYYWAGHEVHWIQALRSANDIDNRPLLGRLLDVGDDGTLTVEVGATIHRLWNHDPARLRSFVARNQDEVSYQPGWSALRTRASGGSYVFSVCQAGTRRSCPNHPSRANISQLGRLALANG